MLDWLGTDAFKNVASVVGSGLSAIGTYNTKENQKKQFGKMFDLEKSQLERNNKKEDY